MNHHVLHRDRGNWYQSICDIPDIACHGYFGPGNSGGSTFGSRGHRPPNLAQAPQIFGHSSSATGWINWFYSKFRLAVVASQMMRGQAPQIFFLEPPLPGRRVPKSYSSCSCSCCSCYTFSKIHKALLVRSAAQRNFAYTFVLIFPTDLPSQMFHIFSN